MSDALLAGAQPVHYRLYERGAWSEVDAAIVAETSLCIHVNGQEIATYQCSPFDQEPLALGFLRSEGFIAGLDDIDLIELTQSGTCIDVWLRKAVEPPARAIKTSGCGGGVTFDDLTQQRQPLAATFAVAPEQIVARFREMDEHEVLYPLTRGVHTSGLCSPDQVLFIAEDVGRHNTLDKLWGKAMLAGVPTEDRIIITTGRISSEMLGKAAKMGVPIVASRTSPTSRSVALAQAWNITVIGYVRRDSFRVYSAPDRVAARE